MRRYLPLVTLTTAVVVVLPAALVSAIISHGGPLLMAASGLTAVAISTVFATAGAALWKRRERSRDVVFAELLLWGWLRRCWSERRLSQARGVYDAARKSGPTVSIELVTGLSRLLEARDAHTHRHGQRVARYAGEVAQAMHLPPGQVAKIRTAAAVHDVGKLYTPREILNNPNRLSDAEYEVAKRHAAWGGRMLADVGDPEITAMVCHHHERIDGRGYPDGLAGPEIPLGARIIAVADTFDAITSSRAYRAACTQKKALDVLAEEAGSQLDPAVVNAFRNRYAGRRSVAALALAATAPERVLAGLQTASQGLTSGAGAVASILPSLGAAGLLALAPGVHRDAFSAHSVNRQGQLSQASPMSTFPAGVTTPPARPRRASGTTTPSRPTRSSHRRSPTPLRGSPQAPSSSNNAPSAVTPVNAPSPQGRDPVTAGPPHPIPAPPTPAPPVTPPHVIEVPTIPAPPVPPPVTLPSVPSVNAPPVQVPSVPGAGALPSPTRAPGAGS